MIQKAEYQGSVNLLQIQFGRSDLQRHCSVFKQQLEGVSIRFADVVAGFDRQAFLEKRRDMLS